MITVAIRGHGHPVSGDGSRRPQEAARRRFSSRTPLTASRSTRATCTLRASMAALLQATPSSRTSFRRSRTRPALMHGGPFANIAHGCNCGQRDQVSLMKLADYRRHRGGLRRRPRRREVLGHQVPQGRHLQPSCRRARRDRPRAQVQWRRTQDRAEHTPT